MGLDLGLKLTQLQGHYPILKHTGEDSPHEDMCRLICP